MTMGPGQGATLWCWLRRFMGGPWHITVQHVQPHGVENHLLVLIWSSQQVHLQTLLNQTRLMDAPPTLPPWHEHKHTLRGLFSNTNLSQLFPTAELVVLCTWFRVPLKVLLFCWGSAYLSCNCWHFWAAASHKLWCFKSQYSDTL